MFGSLWVSRLNPSNKKLFTNQEKLLIELDWTSTDINDSP